MGVCLCPCRRRWRGVGLVHPLFTRDLIGPKGQNKQKIKLGMTLSGAAPHVQTQKCKTQQLRVRIFSPSCTRSRTCTWGGTAKLFLHSFYWQLLLKVTHISRGAEFQEKEKKKLASYVTSAWSWQAPRNRAARRRRKLGHRHRHTHSLTRVHNTACAESHCPLLGPGWGAGETP